MISFEIEKEINKRIYAFWHIASCIEHRADGKQEISTSSYFCYVMGGRFAGKDMMIKKNYKTFFITDIF